MPSIIKPTLAKSFFKKDVTPLIALMGGALTWMAYKGYEHLQAPDVFISPERRSRDAHDKYDEDEAVQFKRNTAKHYRHKEDSVAYVSVFEPYSAAWWKKRAAVATNPESATASGASNLQ